MNPRYEEMRDLLTASRYFKLVCGAGNENAEEVRRLAVIYTLAGGNGFDVSATPEIVRACMRGIDQAHVLASRLGHAIPVRPFVTVSVGMRGDHHVRKAYIVDSCVECGKCIPVCPTNAIPKSYDVIREKCIGCGNCEAVCPPKVSAVHYEHNHKELRKILPACIEAGAENIELHAAVPDDESIMEEWKVVNEVQPNNFISMCLDRSHLSNLHLVDRIRRAKEIAGDRLVIQADGVPMSGGSDDFNTTLQAVAIADLINKNLVQEDRRFRNLPILLSGGTNGKTADLARLCNVRYSGVSVGTHARKVVQRQVDNPAFDADLDGLNAAVQAAQKLVSGCIVA